MNVLPNPFTNRGVVTSSEDFVGRERQIAEVIGKLRKMGSSSIVGERRIGKSSLLYHLAQTGARRLNDSAYQFYYLDFQEAPFHTANGFFRSVLNRIGADAAVITKENSPNNNLTAFGEQIVALQQAGKRIVLCLDEFENSFAHGDQFTNDFFDDMRAKLGMGRLAFVTATQTPLQELCLKGQLVSPFFNVFTVVRLGEFTAAEAQQFVAAYGQKVSFTDDELKFIRSYLDPHPLRLQILCDWVMKNREQHLADWALAAEILAEYTNFFPGVVEKAKGRASKVLSLDNIKKLIETIKASKEIISGSGKK